MDRLEILKFYADWCVPCKVYAREFDSATTKLGVVTKSINIDDEENRALVEAYDVKSIPYTVILKDGEPVQQFSGAITGRQLTTTIKKAST